MLMVAVGMVLIGAAGGRPGVATELLVDFIDEEAVGRAAQGNSHAVLPMRALVGHRAVVTDGTSRKKELGGAHCRAHA